MENSEWNTGAFMGVLFSGIGDAEIHTLRVILSGIGFSATLAPPSAIQADVIDFDQPKTGPCRGFTPWYRRYEMVG